MAAAAPRRLMVEPVAADSPVTASTTDTVSETRSSSVQTVSGPLLHAPTANAIERVRKSARVTTAQLGPRR